MSLYGYTRVFYTVENGKINIFLTHPNGFACSPDGEDPMLDDDLIATIDTNFVVGVFCFSKEELRKSYDRIVDEVAYAICGVHYDRD